MKCKKKLRKKAEKVFREAVIAREGNTCRKCRRHCEGSNRHVSHIIPRSKDGRLKYDPENGKILCYHCHINWWHKNPCEAGLWFTTCYPETWESLESKRIENIGKRAITVAEFEDMIQTSEGVIREHGLMS